MTIFFPDVSNYQGGLTIQNGTPAVFAKASEGTGFRDSTYAGFRNQAAAKGAVFVGYHFLHTGSIDAQAALALEMVGTSTPLMMDIESGDVVSMADVMSFVAAYRRRGGKVTLAYLPKWYWGNMGSPDLSALTRAGVALVSSNYTAYSDNGPGWQPYGGVTPAIWQYTDNQNYGGMAVDFNAFKGTQAQLAALVGGSPPPPAMVDTSPVVRKPEVELGSVGNLLAEIVRHYPDKAKIYITSGQELDKKGDPHGTHGAGSLHYGGSYNGSYTEAIDLGAGPSGLGTVGDAEMRDLAQWLLQFSSKTVELIHTTPFNTDNGFYVKNQNVQQPGFYGPQTEQAHLDHVHFATSAALANQILAQLGPLGGNDVSVQDQVQLLKLSDDGKGNLLPDVQVTLDRAIGLIAFNSGRAAQKIEELVNTLAAQPAGGGLSQADRDAIKALTDAITVLNSHLK